MKGTGELDQQSCDFCGGTGIVLSEEGGEPHECPACFDVGKSLIQSGFFPWLVVTLICLWIIFMILFAAGSRTVSWVVSDRLWMDVSTVLGVDDEGVDYHLPKYAGLRSRGRGPLPPRRLPGSLTGAKRRNRLRVPSRMEGVGMPPRCDTKRRENRVSRVRGWNPGRLLFLNRIVS